jgi:hypothetical protein
MQSKVLFFSTQDRQSILLWAVLIQFASSYSISLGNILILSSCLYWGYSSGLLQSGVQTNLVSILWTYRCITLFFSVSAPCRQVRRCQRFGGIYRIHLQEWRQYGDSISLWIVYQEPTCRQNPEKHHPHHRENLSFHKTSLNSSDSFLICFTTLYPLAGLWYLRVGLLPDCPFPNVT